MALILRVDTEQLRRTAQSFNTTGGEIKNLTGQMTQTVNSLSGQIWTGSAASTYVSKFTGLQDDINRMCKMISEHVQDLTEMAAAYDRAETEAQNTIKTLQSDVII